MSAVGTVYGVGVGPGDPELLTLKALRIIQATPVLAYAAGEPLAAEHHNALEQGLTTAMQQLARAIARDGEGATLLLEVQVEGAADEAAAQAIARTVCGSSLVKTAVHGRDPNWGRIVAAAGRAGVPMDPDAVALWLGEHQLMAAGQPLAGRGPAVGWPLVGIWSVFGRY